MAILGYDECCVGSKSTIHKLVVIQIGKNGINVKMRIYELHVLALYDSPNHILCNARRGFLSNDFLVLLQNLIGNT